MLDGLTAGEETIVEEAAGSISRMGADQGLLATFTSRMRRLPPGARRHAVRGVAGLMVAEGGGPARLEAWVRAEGDSDVGRDLRAVLDELIRER